MAWSALMRQMGCDYKGKDAVKDFKHNAKATLKKVRKVYPLLKISDVAGGFWRVTFPMLFGKQRNRPVSANIWFARRELW